MIFLVRLASPGFALHDDWPDICQFQPGWTSPSHHDLSVTEKSLPFTASALQKAFLLLFTTHASQLQLSFGLPSLFPACPGKVAIFLPDSVLTLCFTFCTLCLCSLLTGSCRPFCTQRTREQEMELIVSEDQPALSGPSPSEQPPTGYPPPVSWTSWCLFSCSPKEFF